MELITTALLEHGYILLFVLVSLDQLGLPVPTLPVVVAAGALAGAGQLDASVAVGLVTIGAVFGEWVWYELGRKQGVRIVRTLCKIALEPDACVRSTQATFGRHGPRSLLFAKWIPGFQTVAPPLAGVAKMRRLPFFAYATVGAFFWAGTLVTAGYVLRDQLGAIGAMAAELGGLAVALLGVALAIYLGLKFVQRHRILRSLRGARITPEELRQKIDEGEPVAVVDLRHPIDFASDPYLIPGAQRMEPDELENRHEEIPRDRDIILYCT